MTEPRTSREALDILAELEAEFTGLCADTEDKMHQSVNEGDYSKASRLRAEAFGYARAALRVKRARDAALRVTPPASAPQERIAFLERQVATREEHIRQLIAERESVTPPASAPQETLSTECCDKSIQPDQRYCPRCGWEARVREPERADPVPSETQERSSELAALHADPPKEPR